MSHPQPAQAVARASAPAHRQRGSHAGLHYFVGTGIHSQAVKEKLREHAREEQEHAEGIAERIKQLGGKPVMNPAMLTDLLFANEIGGAAGARQPSQQPS